jgi:hypothetical protein
MSILCKLGLHKLSPWLLRDLHDPNEGWERRCYRLDCAYEQRSPK